jgi:hypothetical protein
MPKKRSSDKTDACVAVLDGYFNDAIDPEGRDPVVLGINIRSHHAGYAVEVRASRLGLYRAPKILAVTTGAEVVGAIRAAIAIFESETGRT